MRLVLTSEEYRYMQYIEYGDYHGITPPPRIGDTIKRLCDDGLLAQVPNPSRENSPLFTRFTRYGRLLFAAHELAHGAKWCVTCGLQRLMGR
jgi:hypothetical protein